MNLEDFKELNHIRISCLFMVMAPAIIIILLGMCIPSFYYYFCFFFDIKLENGRIFYFFIISIIGVMITFLTIQLLKKYAPDFMFQLRQLEEITENEKTEKDKF